MARNASGSGNDAPQRVIAAYVEGLSRADGDVDDGQDHRRCRDESADDRTRIQLSQIDRSQALPRKDWTMLQPKTAKIALLMAVLAILVVLVARQ